MFSKKPKNDSRRSRQSIVPDATGNRTVFSYHASRSTDSATNPGGRSVKRLWVNATKPSPRHPQKSWLRRVPRVVILLAIAAFLMSNLILDRNPKVVALVGTQGRQILLRDQASYEGAAQTILASSLANTNKITIDTAGIERAFRRQFPEIERVSVALPFVGRQPVIYIQPAQPALLLKVVDGGLFVVDTSGRALMNASEGSKLEKLGLVVVEDQAGLPVKLGGSILPSSNVAFITEVAGQLKAKKITITSVTLIKGTNQLDVRVEGKSYVIKFNLRGDARAEVGSYLAVAQHLEREQKVPGSYIDVRVDNRAYYR